MSTAASALRVNAKLSTGLNITPRIAASQAAPANPMAADPPTIRPTRYWAARDVIPELFDPHRRSIEGQQVKIKPLACPPFLWRLVQKT